MRYKPVHLLCYGLMLCMALPLAAQVPIPQAEYLPVTEGSPEERSVPFLTQAETVANWGYVEEEYLLSGTTNLYDYVDNAAQSPLVAVVQSGLPYVTRIIVRRPADPAKFNGTVVLEVVNATRGFDSDISWNYSSRMIMREGAIYVGMTSKRVTVDFLRDKFGRPPYIARNYSRYASLYMRHDGQVWDMLSQTAALLKADSDVTNPLAGFGVERIILTGYSQSAGYLKTYVNSFHRDAILGDGRQAIDGYFEGGGSFASKVPNPPNTRNEFNPGGDPRNLILLPAPAPLMRFQTSTEVLSFFGSRHTRQTEADSPLLRTYEMAGGAHVDAFQKDFEEEQNRAELGLEPAWPACTPSASTLRVEYVHSALLSRLDDWIEYGRKPPDSRLLSLLTLASGHVVFATDGDGNQVGGVRLPQLDVPTGVWSDQSPVIWCLLHGSYTPFSEEELAQRYPWHYLYVRQSFAAVVRAYREGFLLPADGWEIIIEANMSDIGAPTPWWQRWQVRHKRGVR